MLPASAFRRFTELLRADRYELASSALARAVKDEDVEITDDIRELYTMLTRVRLKGEGPGAEELPQRQYEAAIRREVRRALSEAKGFSGSEYGLEAPEDADYELVRVERGDTDKEAFMRLKRWAEDNGYTVSPGERESYLDYRFEKGGETYRATKTR
jgi:hypothetical protein